jgi:hypothetical protein
MNNEIIKDIKKLLLLDSLLSSTDSLSRILDDVEDELEDFLGKPTKSSITFEDIFKNKVLK